MNIISHKSSNFSMDHLIQLKRDLFSLPILENIEYKIKVNQIFEELIKSELGH